ncbi:Serralysin C precursor [Azoarcus sp. Aa7]|nr:Serralysin C precursor [Azoarcus sp. Aa7]
MALASLTTQQIIDQLDSGYHWAGSTITYAFPVTAADLFSTDEGGSFRPLDATQQAYAEVALASWDELIAPSFAEVSGSASDVEFGLTLNADYAHAYFPSYGSVWFRSGDASLAEPEVGGYGYMTYVHEVGHALGLDHMGDYNGYAPEPTSYQDSTVLSVMSYFGPSYGSWSAGTGQIAWADWIGSDGRLYQPQTPMLDDVLAIQSIYGADHTTRTGDTTYGFGSNVTGAMAEILDFTRNAHPVLTLYDAGGNDTLNLSGWSSGSTVDIAPGAYSSCNDMTNNIAIAYSTDIENVVCGDGSDSISGNTLANRLDGGGGNDTIYGLSGDDELLGGGGNDYLDGGTGIDWATLGADLGSYAIIYDATTGIFTFQSQSTGIDTVTGTEYFRFANDVTRSAGELAGGQRAAPIAGITLSGTGRANILTGTDADDQLFGLGGADSLDGGFGHDLLDGGRGADLLSGGNGDDTYVVDNRNDVVTESNGLLGGIDTVHSTVSFALGADLEHLTLTGRARANGTGNDGDNVIAGNAGRNTLDGRGGDDTLIGAGGRDILIGGAGHDVFRFNAISDTSASARAADMISDFAIGEDLLDLSLIDANLLTAENDAFDTTFVAAGTAFYAPGQLQFAGGILYGNVDADAKPEFAINLGQVTLSHSDLVF